MGAQIRFLREAYAHTISELDDRYQQQLEAELPTIDYDDVDFGPDEVVDPAVAWPYLVEIQQHLVAQAEAATAHRGSGEWLWWLRRTRGQFHVNELESTEGYTQSVAEVLAAGNSRPSEPASTEGILDPSQGERFTFAATTDAVAAGSLDLLWLRHAALQLYHLHATMMRCAKGQGVIFGEGGVPTAEMDQTLEYAIHVYDQRNEAGSRNALVAVGLHHADPLEPVTDSALFGGKVPMWFHRQTPAGDPLDLDDPTPAAFSVLELDRIAPFRDASPLNETQVALILLLWACQNVMSRDPEHFETRSASAVQFGYMLLGLGTQLRVALDEVVEWLHNDRSPVIPETTVPASGAELEELLRSLEPETRPVLIGSPIHDAGTHPSGLELCIVDLLGASHRLLVSLTRPRDGAAVNVWSQHFEHDVQEIIDDTPWRPEGALRQLIGKSIRRRDGTTLTDLDAIGLHKGDLLLVSCKSIAMTAQHRAGDFAAMRNMREKTEAAIAHWDQVISELCLDPDLLGITLPPEVRLRGVVVLPETPWVSEPEHYMPGEVLGLPPAVSTDELTRALTATGGTT